jgi:hypothetical protein
LYKRRDTFAPASRAVKVTCFPRAIVPDHFPPAGIVLEVVEAEDVKMFIKFRLLFNVKKDKSLEMKSPRLLSFRVYSCCCTLSLGPVLMNEENGFQSLTEP